MNDCCMVEDSDFFSMVTRVVRKGEPTIGDAKRFTSNSATATTEGTEEVHNAMMSEYLEAKAVVDKAKSCSKCSDRINEIQEWWNNHDCIEISPRVISIANRVIGRRGVKELDEDDQDLFYRLILCPTCSAVLIDAKCMSRSMPPDGRDKE